jgi:hypothetical protein
MPFPAVKQLISKKRPHIRAFLFFAKVFCSCTGIALLLRKALQNEALAEAGGWRMTFRTAYQRSAAAAVLIFANLGILSAQPDSVYHLAAGTRIRLKMDVELSSKVAGVNDTFTAVVAKPVLIRDTIAVPAGTVVEGRVRGVNAGIGRRATESLT